jgi:hypothetical protein
VDECDNSAKKQKKTKKQRCGTCRLDLIDGAAVRNNKSATRVFEIRWYLQQWTNFVSIHRCADVVSNIDADAVRNNRQGDVINVCAVVAA